MNTSFFSAEAARLAKAAANAKAVWLSAETVAAHDAKDEAADVAYLAWLAYCAAAEAADRADLAAARAAV